MKKFDREIRGRDAEWSGNWLEYWRYKRLLKENGRLYPTRKIVELASGVAPGRDSYEATDAGRSLTRLGFTIVRLSEQEINSFNELRVR